MERDEVVSSSGVKENSGSWHDYEDFASFINLDLITRHPFDSLRIRDYQQEALNIQQR